MVLIYEDDKLVGTAEDARSAGKMIETQFNESTQRGYFGNAAVKGLYKLGGHTYQGIKGVVYEYESSCEDDPMYRIIPVEKNTFLPGCEKLPTTVFNP